MNKSKDNEDLSSFTGICGTIIRAINELKDKSETGVRWTQNELRPFLWGSRAKQAREECPKNKLFMEKLVFFLEKGKCSSQRAWASAFISKFMNPKEAVKLLKGAVKLHEKEKMLDAKNWTLYHLGNVLWLLKSQQTGESQDPEYKEAVEFMTKRLETEEVNDTRMFIINALGVLANPQFIPQLTDLIECDFIGIRAWAVQAIGDIAERNEIKFEDDGSLKGPLKHEWKKTIEVLEKIVLACEEETIEDAITNNKSNNEKELQKLEIDYNEMCKEWLAIEAINSLSRIGGKESFKNLISVVNKHKDYLMQARAITAITRMRNFEKIKIKEWKYENKSLIGIAIKDLSQLLYRKELQYQLMWCLEKLVGKFDENNQVECLVSLIKDSSTQNVQPLAWLASHMHYEKIRVKLIELEKNEIKKSDKEKPKINLEGIPIIQHVGRAIMEMGGPAIIDALRIQQDVFTSIQKDSQRARVLLNRCEKNLDKNYKITLYSSGIFIIIGIGLIFLAIGTTLLSRQFGTQELLFSTGGFSSLFITYYINFIKRPRKEIQDAAVYSIGFQLPFMRYVQTYTQTLIYFQNQFRKGKLEFEDLIMIDKLIGKASDSSLKQLTSLETENEGSFKEKTADILRNRLLHTKKSNSTNNNQYTIKNNK
jgi:hypothetical protein